MYFTAAYISNPIFLEIDVFRFIYRFSNYYNNKKDKIDYSKLDSNTIDAKCELSIYRQRARAASPVSHYAHHKCVILPSILYLTLPVLTITNTPLLTLEPSSHQHSALRRTLLTDWGSI